jgi:hypothetical protein
MNIWRSAVTGHWPWYGWGGIRYRGGFRFRVWSWLWKHYVESFD